MKIDPYTPSKIEKTYEQVMNGDLSQFGEVELARAIELLMARYIPNLIVSGSHPHQIAFHRSRLVSAMAEMTARQQKAIVSALAGGDCAF